MKIELRRADASLEIKKVGAKETDGERKRPVCGIKLVITAPPTFLDDYLAGHETGAQPSSVFWRTYDEKPGKFVRYNGLGRCELAVPDPNSTRYALKISTRPPEGHDIENDDYFGYREFAISNVILKALTFEAMANYCIVTAALEFKPLSEAENQLMSLRLEPALLASIWNMSPDMFDAENNPNGPTEADIEHAESRLESAAGDDEDEDESQSEMTLE